MALEKRKRSANWLASEKMLLLDIVKEHFHVIENKKTDGFSMKEKSAEWVIVSDKYNSQTTHVHRTADNLKMQWESMKKSAKKEASLIRMHLIQTGGGPPENKRMDPHYEKIMALITPSAVGLQNPYDSDHIMPPLIQDGAHVNAIDTAPGIEVATIMTREPSDDVDNNLSVMQQDEYSVVVSFPTLEEESVLEKNKELAEKIEADGVLDWGDYTPKMLQTPRSKQLRLGKDNKRPTKEWTSKRRPQLSLGSCSLESLHDAKMKAVAMQMEHAAKEREEHMKMNNLELTRAMNVKEASEVCKNKPKWRSVVRAYPASDLA